MTDGPASRNERFVRAAKRLLTFQLAAAAGAALLTGWAVLEVRDLVDERDRLAARLAQVEPTAPAAELQPAGPVAVADPTAATPPEDNVSAEIPEESGNGRDNSPPPNVNVVDESPPPPPPPPPPQQLTDCVLLNGTRSRCPLPWQRIAPGICLDVQRRQASCPSGRTPPPPPPPEDDARDPPPPVRDCRSVEGRPIVCAPPYRTTPVPGVCVDRNNRPLRCPRGVIPREPNPTTTGTTPTRPPPTRPTTTAPTRTRQPAGTATTSEQPSAVTNVPSRTTRPTTTSVPARQQPSTATTPSRTVRQPPLRRVPTTPPDSNQAQPQ